MGSCLVGVAEVRVEVPQGLQAGGPFVVGQGGVLDQLPVQVASFAVLGLSASCSAQGGLRIAEVDQVSGQFEAHGHAPDCQVGLEGLSHPPSEIGTATPGLLVGQQGGGHGSGGGGQASRPPGWQ